LRQEIDITPLLSQALHDGKQVALLRFEPLSSRYLPASIDRLDELLPGKFGILEPPPNAPTVSLNQLDLAFVPGIAFDRCGHRLGRGQGHYDQLLAEFRGVKCGVAFDAQIVEEIPVEAHDVLMDYVLTPTRWLTCIRATA
jgi:5-formyltetrahydrofolate cyclo-ligase